MEQRSFIFIKDFITCYGVIKKNSELRLFRGLIYINGGMISPSYGSIFLNLIENDELRNQYLIEQKIINNKV